MRALCTVYENFNATFRSTEYLPHLSLYRISCPFIAKRTNIFWITFMVNVQWLFPFFHSNSMSILNIVWLSHQWIRTALNRTMLRNDKCVILQHK